MGASPFGERQWMMAVSVGRTNMWAGGDADLCTLNFTDLDLFRDDLVFMNCQSKKKVSLIGKAWRSVSEVLNIFIIIWNYMTDIDSDWRANGGILVSAAPAGIMEHRLSPCECAQDTKTTTYLFWKACSYCNILIANLPQGKLSFTLWERWLSIGRRLTRQPELVGQTCWFGTSSISAVCCLYCGAHGVSCRWEVVVPWLCLVINM